MMANGRIRPLWPVLISILLALLVSGCSNSTENSGLSLVDEQGNHPATFLSTHPGFAVTSVSQCTQCHGDDLTGGISNQSCFLSKCHHGDPPSGWASPAEHGASAKRAPGNSGFKSCQICHADDFSGDGAGISCFLCHATAPHPANWRTGGTYVHTNTDGENASVCAQCHLDGANSPIGPPSPPATAGTPPGCFNSTLCHGASAVPHPVDNTWVTAPPAAQPHGDDAKAAPGATTGFNYCQACHGTGTDFAGGSSGVSCYTCHGASAPHPASWRTGNTYVHTTTDQGNASVCAFCHTDGANSPIGQPSPPAPVGTPPGCFNNTLCHEAGVPHPVGSPWWGAPPAAQLHGNDAKATPGATTGFNYCQVCHGTGTDFAGGSSGVSCYTCHGASAPHPASWRTGDTYVHTTVAEGNASVCAFCHTGGANSPVPPPSPPAPGGTPPGCFNSTLCHAAGVPHPVGNPAWWTTPPAAQPHGNDAKAVPGATTGFDYCQVCHGTGTDFAGGSSGVSCYTCHTARPHPIQWRTGDTYVHTTTDEGNASVCAFCHTGGANSPVPPPSPPAPGGTPPGCFNSTLCHGDAVPAGTHGTGWLDFDNSAAFHGSFVTQVTCETAACHPISGHPTCTSCHFDNTGSRANASLSPPFAHDGNVFSNHRNDSYSSVGNVCENCHQTSRTFRAGALPSSCGPSGNHPDNRGCHYDASLLDPVLTNPNF